MVAANAQFGAGLGVYGGGITTGTLTSTVIDDGNNPNSPGLAVLSDWRLLACYSYGTAADFEDNNSIRCKVSLAPYTPTVAPSWSSESVLLSPTTCRSMLYGDVHVLIGGTIAGSYNETPNPSGGCGSLDTSTVNVFDIHVSGNVVTAGTVTQVSTGHPLGGTGVFSQTGPVQLKGSGNLMMTVYGGATTFGLGAYFSTAGLTGTWSNFTTLIAPDPTHVNEWDETDCQVAPAGVFWATEGHIDCFVRQDAPEANGGYDLISTNDPAGLTGWSAPARIANLSTVSASLNVGRPSTVLHPSGGIAMLHRWTGPETAYTVMYPPYATAKVPTRYGPAATQNWYNAMVVLPDHTLGSVAAIQVASGPVKTKIVFQQFALTAP